MRTRLSVTAFALILCTMFCTTNASATTWGRGKVICPICKTENQFYRIGSYGSYIYGWPSKFQHIYWPSTTENFVYTCKKCHLSTFMWDFTKVPKEKFDAIKKALAAVKDKPKFEDYTDVATPGRIDLAEKVYEQLGKDDEFWCQFYRIKAYHLDEVKDVKAAAIARKKALEIAEKVLKDKKRAGEHKEYRYIAGCMKYLTDDKKGAKKEFETAKGLTYKKEGLNQQQNTNANGFFDRLIGQYLEKFE